MKSLKLDVFFIVGWGPVFKKMKKKSANFKTFILTFMEYDICLYGLLLIRTISPADSHVLFLRKLPIFVNKQKKKSFNNYMIMLLQPFISRVHQQN